MIDHLDLQAGAEQRDNLGYQQAAVGAVGQNLQHGATVALQHRVAEPEMTVVISGFRQWAG